MVSALYRWPVILLVIHSSAVVGAQQPNVPPAAVVLRSQEPPLPAGQRITAGDGDTVVIEGDSRVRIVRRRPAFVRIISNTEQSFVVIVTENLRAHGDSPVRVSDRTYEFSGLGAASPLPARWEGPVWLEEYFSAGSPAAGFGGGMLGIETAEGKIVFRSGGPFSPDQASTDEAGAVTVRFQGMGIGGGRLPFDQEEARAVAQAAQNASNRGRSMVGGMNGLVGATDMSWLAMGSGGVGITSETLVRESGPPPPLDPSQAPRVNGAPLRKIHDVAPVMPEAARAAGIRGIVILEVTIAADGTVSDARVLRGIPLVDQAAIDAVRQWRYEPLHVGGLPAPFIATVTVPFPPPPK